MDAQVAKDNLVKLLDDNGVEYKSFEHKAAYTYDELLEVQKQTGFFGTEMKCMVLKADEEFMVYVTTQGNRVNFDAIKEHLSAGKVRLATPEELKEHFGAEPGCAYPFGFDTKFKVFVDPKIYTQEWMLFSPAVPTGTIQAKGADLKNVFESLSNKVEEVTNFNQV